MPETTEDAAYAALQKELERVSPDVQDSAWGHKYFSLLFPEKLDDIHNIYHQRFRLIKVLQIPPSGEGRYLSSGRFKAIARELNLPINILCRLLWEIEGGLYRYWRMGTTGGSQNNESFWDEMREANVVSMGWKELGDLSWVEFNQDSKDNLRQRMQLVYGHNNAGAVPNTGKVFNFVVGIKEGDLVLAAKGSKILGIGKVTGPYSFRQDSEFPHQRQVEWLSLESWKLPDESEGLQSAVSELKNPEESRGG